MQIRKRGDGIKKKSSPLKLLSQSQPNFAEMILRWSPFKIVSVSTVLYPRWPPLLKIENTSNGQNCCIWSHDGLKFELCKYNYELFNILYSGFSYELLTFADFDRLCKLRINKKKIILKSSRHKPLGQFQPNLAWMVLRWSPFKIVSGSSILYPRWLPLLKIQLCQMAKTAVFQAMMGSNLYCVSIIMCFLAHLAIGHMNFYHKVSFIVRCPSVVVCR
jgi:hypothetical protein